MASDALLTPGEADRPTGGEPAAARAAEPRVHRFAQTERWLHWIHGGSFLLMLATGLVLFLPQLAGVVGNRPLIKGAHLVVAAFWLTGFVLVAVLGDRRVVRRSWRQFLALDREDLRWLTSRAAREEPQTRFNGGQRLHGLVQGALTILFFVSGAFLWLGERNNELRLPGALPLHDGAMIIGTAFVIGHIWIATSPGIRASLSGMTDGTVPQSYARKHHAAWDPASEPIERRPALTPARLAAAGAVLLAGLIVAALLA